ncbi:hypothetical protein HDU78_001663 [Chytriomyces hyalinus]|nr:hypothetical protein HDU78_001663 [Chytriomyces hyalinus]
MPVDQNSPWLARHILYDVILSPCFYQPFLASCLLHVVWYFGISATLISKLYPSGGQKAKAWISALLTSSVIVAGGLPVCWQFLQLGPMQTTADLTDLDTRYSWCLGAFFTASLWMDCLLGTLFYPAQLQLVTGWIHHITYTYIILWHISRGQVGLLMACSAVQEIPTILLASGSINRRWRTDVGFGVAFFLTRVCFHFATIVYAFQVYTVGWYWVIPALPFPVHLAWFYRWGVGFFSQGKRREIKLE